MKFVESELWRRITAHAQRDPGHPAYIDRATNAQLTYAQLIDQSHAHAATSLAPSPAMRADNSLHFPIAFFGTLLRGASVMPAPLTLPPAEESRFAQLSTHIATSPIEPSLLLTTSGTTAEPKLVRRNLKSLNAVSKMMVDAIGFTPADRVIAAVPLSHSYGIEHGLLAPLWAGSTVLLCDGLDLTQLAEALASGATIFPAVPSMIELIAGFSEELSLKSLRHVYTAGAPLPQSVAAIFEERFGLPIGQVYGATEIGSVLYRDPSRDTAGSVGRAMEGVSVRILNVDTYQPLPIGEEGEVAVAAPSMLAGYLDSPAPLIDGHYPTGDIGRLNAAGELTLVGRVRLLIDVGGAKVNPLEVERILESHPAVAAAVVLPLRLSETVNKIRAIVVPADPQTPPSTRALRDHARQFLAPYKVPRVIDFRDSLPRTAAGKIARQQLEAECPA